MKSVNENGIDLQASAARAIPIDRQARLFGSVGDYEASRA